MPSIPIYYQPNQNQQSSGPELQPRIDAVVKGVAVTQTPTLKDKIASAFNKDQFMSAAKMFFDTVVMDNLKWMLRNSAYRFVDMIFHTQGPNNWWNYNNVHYSGNGAPPWWNANGGYYGNGWYGYGNGSTAPWNNPAANYNGGYQSGNRAAGTGYNGGNCGGSIRYNSDSDGKAVVNAAREIIKSKGCVSLAQIFDLSGLGAQVDPTMFTRGWRSIDAFTLVNEGPGGSVLYYGPQIPIT